MSVGIFLAFLHSIEVVKRWVFGISTPFRQDWVLVFCGGEGFAMAALLDVARQVK